MSAKVERIELVKTREKLKLRLLTKYCNYPNGRGNTPMIETGISSDDRIFLTSTDENGQKERFEINLLTLTERLIKTII